MKRFLVPIAITAAGLAVTAPLASSTPTANSADPHIVIGFDESFTGPTSLAGTFVLAGSVSDTGTRTEELTIQPNPDGTSSFTVEASFHGALGTFDAVGRGTLGPSGASRVVGEGAWKIISGTGAYSGASGEGRFVAVGDFQSNTVIGTDEGTLRLAK
jgi:hypothetical protein